VSKIKKCLCSNLIIFARSHTLSKKNTNFQVKKKSPIAITDTAYKKIQEIKAQKQIAEEYFLRVGVKSAGCGIASYIIGFDHANEKDEVFELENLKIIIEKMQVMYLAGKSVDYGEANGEIGFIFRDNY